MIAVLFAVSVLVFVIFILVPGGDPASRMAGKNPTAQNVQNIRQKWGFDRPIYVQYVKMMRQRHPAGPARRVRRPHLLPEPAERGRGDQEGIPATFSLCIGAGMIWLFFGVLVGVFAAVNAGKWSDRLVTTFALIGISMPVFWLGIVMRYFLAEKPNNPPFPDGEIRPLHSQPRAVGLPPDPALVLPLGAVHRLLRRVLRSNMLDTMNEDYVRTARAKGIAPRGVLTKHVLRNSLIPIVTLFGLDFAAVLGGGAILTETVFSLKGVGWYAAQSVGDLDVPPIMGVTLYGAFFIVLFSAVVDFLYACLDPRIGPS